jgi:hypothetical protein
MTPRSPWRPLRGGHTLFAMLLAAYVAIFAVTFPVTYGIDDESNILSLALALGQGTPFLDEVGIDLDADVEWDGHRISKFSPFHAGLLIPGVLSDWRLSFLVAPLFFLGGAFVFRGMLGRHGLSDGWTALYFLEPGLLYYSRTLVAAVPAAVMGLAGASFLLRDKPRPAAAGLALGAAVLLHVWLAPVAAAFAAVWWIDSGRRDARMLGLLLAGALPAIVLMALYNLAVTGDPLLNAYWITGHQRAFDGRQFESFLPFYVLSLGIAPLAGWAALSRRWAGTWAIPATTTAVVLLAALYYYRDGVEYGLAGWVPGRRFLLPVTVLACLPAARLLASRFGRMQQWRVPAQAAVIAAFTIGFGAISMAHQQYLEGQATVQATLRGAIPEGAPVLANAHAFKAFAPVNGRWALRLMRDGGEPAATDRPDEYRVWIGRPGEHPTAGWFAERTPRVVEVRSLKCCGLFWV